MALLPLKIANLKSMRKMQALQPEMTRINEKYKGIGMSDPTLAAEAAGDHGAVQEERRESHGRLHPHADSAPVPVRVLASAGGDH